MGAPLFDCGEQIRDDFSAWLRAEIAFAVDADATASASMWRFAITNMVWTSFVLPAGFAADLVVAFVEVVAQVRYAQFRLN